jgi:cadmium resistance protein CadD (predicted permease)
MDQIGWLGPTLLVGIIAFITTNIDNLLLLILLFSQSNFRKRHIVTGQYLGFIVILLISAFGFFGKFILPLAWIGFLGIVPIIMGIMRMRELVHKQKRKQEGAVSEDEYMRASLPPPFARIALEPFLDLQTYRVTLMTIGNGSDNVSTYTPLFAGGSFIRVVVLTCLFFLLVGVWCFIGYTVAHFPGVAYIIERYGSILLPFAYILLGLYIMTQSGTFLLLAQLVRLK